MDTFLFISYVNEGTSPGSARSNSSSIALALFTKVSSRNRIKALTLREGTFFLGGGGRAGASEGRVISESEHQRGRAIPSFSAIQGEDHTFSRIFNGDFCDVIFHFSLTD